MNERKRNMLYQTKHPEFRILKMDDVLLAMNMPEKKDVAKLVKQIVK